MKLISFMEPKPVVELQTFRHPTDEQVRLSHRYILRATTICRLSSLVWIVYLERSTFTPFEGFLILALV